MWTIQPSLGERLVVNKRHYRRDGLSVLGLIAGTRGQRKLTQNLGIPELSHLAAPDMFTLGPQCSSRISFSRYQVVDWSSGHGESTTAPQSRF